MNPLIAIYQQLENDCEDFRQNEFSFSGSTTESPLDIFLHEQLKKKSHELTADQLDRLYAEVFQYGPLEKLFQQKDITEILLQGPEEIWIEKNGQLEKYADKFLTPKSYQKIFDRLCAEAKTFVNLDRPFVSAKFRSYRIGILHPCLSHGATQITLRSHPENPWSLETLTKAYWCDSKHEDLLREMIRNRKNFLVVGPTGSGKTSVTNALLQLLSPRERAILIEDTEELVLPNEISTKLLTRTSVDSELCEIRQLDLLKFALRMRPDRLILGEIRGEEAKDFLLLLATGHQGSFGTLHGNDPHQALMRLEMLVQMGAPQWSLDTVRRLIFQCLQNIVVVTKNSDGQRRLQGIYSLQTLESFGFTLNQI